MSWISVHDQLPDDDVAVLIAADGDVWMAWHDADVWYTVDGARLEGVTHWQRLPPAPSE